MLPVELRTRLRTSPLAWLVGYFLLVALLLFLLVRWFPALQGVLVFGEGAQLAEQFDQVFDAASRPRVVPEPLAMVALRGFLALLGAVVFGLPATWIYLITKRQEGYERSFVQMLVILPLVVAGVVRVVRGDLALAFALAGIVAAVRFRTTVKDLKNAVFAFAVIGIGLASGAGGWVLAAILSVGTCFVAYALWRVNVGGTSPQLARYIGPIRLSEALVPGEIHKTVAVGDERLVAPLTPEEIERIPPLVDRLAHVVRADALRKKGKYSLLMLVYASDRVAAEVLMNAVLGEHATRWNLIDVFPGRHGTSTLAYLARLKREVEIGALLEALQIGDEGAIRAAELKPIKGLRDRLT